MDNTEYIKELTKDIIELKDEVFRLRTENGLLRSASEEQRKLNGELRVEVGVLKGGQYVHYGLF